MLARRSAHFDHHRMARPAWRLAEQTRRRARRRTLFLRQIWYLAACACLLGAVAEALASDSWWALVGKEIVLLNCLVCFAALGGTEG